LTTRRFANIEAAANNGTLKGPLLFCKNALNPVVGDPFTEARSFQCSALSWLVFSVDY
jgi:hypothetical protein